MDRALQLAHLEDDAVETALLPGVPSDLVRHIYGRAPGNEIGSGKFSSPESSAALAANAFGPFLLRPADLLPPPGGEAWGWPASSVRLEAIVRFPWAGGRRPCLGVLIETPCALIGVESKRYEPFRAKAPSALSNAYWRAVWGDAMTRYERVRDALRQKSPFSRLDAAQLVKHAFALRTAVHGEAQLLGKRPVLLYLYAEPQQWPDGRPVPAAEVERHRVEIHEFGEMVAGDEVLFRACSYRALLSAWAAGANGLTRAHAAAIANRFDL